MSMDATLIPVQNPYALNDEAELDIIIGRMVRQLMEFERTPAVPETFAAIEAIKDRAVKDAERNGLDAYKVWKIARSIGFQR